MHLACCSRVQIMLAGYDGRGEDWRLLSITPVMPVPSSVPATSWPLFADEPQRSGFHAAGLLSASLQVKQMLVEEDQAGGLINSTSNSRLFPPHAHHPKHLPGFTACCRRYTPRQHLRMALQMVAAEMAYAAHPMVVKCGQNPSTCCICMRRVKSQGRETSPAIPTMAPVPSPLLDDCAEGCAALTAAGVGGCMRRHDISIHDVCYCKFLWTCARHFF